MYVEVRRLSVAQVGDLAPKWMELNPGDLDLLIEYSAKSDPLIGGFMGDDLIAMGGFVPIGILTGTALLWMQSTHATDRHRIALIRVAPKIIECAMERYSRIVGTCSLGERSVRWVTSLGARFKDTDEQCKPFMIGGYDG